MLWLSNRMDHISGSSLLLYFSPSHVYWRQVSRNMLVSFMGIPIAIRGSIGRIGFLVLSGRLLF